MLKIILSLILTAFITIGSKSQEFTNTDTLKKYSYLLIGASFHPQSVLEAPSMNNLRPEAYATGFFVRKNDKLYVGSAYHVFTLFDVYNCKKTNSDIDFWIIRYFDSSGSARFSIIDVREIKNSCVPVFFLFAPDVYFIDVTKQMEGQHVYSIEKFLYGKQKKMVAADETYISYGFPSNGQSVYPNPSDYRLKVQPSYYEGRQADSSHYAPEYKTGHIDSMYITAYPIRYGGTSGSPVFRYLKKKQRHSVEFAGVQSGKNETFNCSYVLKGDLVIKELEGK